MNMEYTPENITSLDEDEVFVFGSNLAGMQNQQEWLQLSVIHFTGK